MNPFADPKKLYFFFDFISHNAYLAWTRMPALAQKYGLELEPVPVLFAGLLGALGQKGPAEVPPKLRWMSWNVIRKAKLHNVAASRRRTRIRSIPWRRCVRAAQSKAWVASSWSSACGVRRGQRGRKSRILKLSRKKSLRRDSML